jgi:protein-tyrosine-phosphatase
VRPEVKQVLREMSIDAAFLRARAIGETPFEETALLVTLAAERDCPGAKLPTRRVAWPLPDPSSAPPEERLEAYRATRDELLRRLPALLRSLD